MDDIDEFYAVQAVIIILVYYISIEYIAKSRNTFILTGEAYLTELITAANHTRLQERLRMPLYCFMALGVEGVIGVEAIVIKPGYI